jgi:SNF2 family DNA or RNA helicase
MATVEDAVVAIAGAKVTKSADIGLIHGAAARIRMRVTVDGETRRRLHRTLAGYRRELTALGFDYDTLEAPATGGPAAAAPSRARPLIGRSRVWVDGADLWLSSPYQARDIVREQIPAARWQKRAVAYKLPATPQAALAIADALGQYGIDADHAATELVKKAHALKGAQALRSREDLPPVPGSKTEAWEHQRQAFWFAREMPGAILDMEMGTGKSKVVCDLIHDSRADTALIVCPERVVGVWPKQFGIHCGGEKHIIDPRRQKRTGEWVLLPIKDRVDLYEHALHECRCGLPHVLISNYAASAHEPFKSWSRRQHFDYIAYDECHRLRSHSGVWSRWGAAMQPHADRLLGGTGTLQAQSPLDVFGPFRAVEPGIFGPTYRAFEKRYAIMGGYENKVVVDYQNEDELAEKLGRIVYRAGEEVLDLPEMLPEVTVTGQLSPKARRAYTALEQDMYAEVVRTLADGSFEVGEVTADNVLVKILRCQQMTGGALPLDDGTIEEIDTEKAKLLADELEDIDPHEPVVVFCRFHHDLDKVEQVADKMGRRYGELSGRRSDALAADATLTEGVQVAGIQIQAGGTGIDLTRSKFGVYYSVGHSLGDYLQSRKRLHRPGQLHSVRFRHLVMEGTIDEDVYAALSERQKVTDRIAEKVRRLQVAV